MNWFTRHFYRLDIYYDLAAEIRQHLAEKTEYLMRDGMTREQAEHAARRAFGNAALIEERGRETWQWPRFENLLRDLSFSARLLRKSPGFAVVAILTLTLGVGANTAVFSLLNGLLLRPLPVPDAQQLVLLRVEPIAYSYSFSLPIFRSLEQRHDVFSSVFAFSIRSSQIRSQIHSQSHSTAEHSGTETISRALVSGDFFTALATPPQLGRYLTPEDDRRGSSEYAAVISDEFWHTRFNRAPDVIGRKLLVDNVAFTIVGVMPASFIGADANSRPQIYLPLASEPLVDAPYNMSEGGYHSWWLRVGSRLKPGVSLAQANADLRSIGPAIFRNDIPDPNFVFGNVKRDRFFLSAQSGAAGYSELRLRYRDPLLVTFVLCIAVLVLACINLASLLLARATMRQREIATRLAIGANRRRLVQQLLVDSLLLAMLGTAAGLAVAPLVSRALVAMLVHSDDGIYLDAAIDWRVFLFAAVAALLATVFVGLLPALQATSGDLNRQMKDGSRATCSRSRRVLPGILLATEVALAMILVAGAGLLSTSLVRLYRSGLGFDPHGLLLVTFDMEKQPLDGVQLAALYHDLDEHFSHLPGVTSLSFSSITPLSGSNWTGAVHLPGGADHDVFHNRVGLNYFRTMRIPLLEGREFSSQDDPHSGTKIILNRAAAKMLFPAGDALGKQVREATYIDGSFKGKEEESYQVVGVVGNTKYTQLRDPAPPTGYFSSTQATETKPSYTAILRINGPVAPLAAAIRHITATLAPEIPAPEFATMDEQVNYSIAAERVMALLSVFFAISALLVTGIGLYGVLSYSTARRTSEIGIRMALGAERTRVVSLIFRENIWIAIGGCALGLLTALLSSRALATFLYGTSPRDPGIMLLSLILLCLIAAIASLIPAMRAASIDPLKALRSE